MTPFELVEEVFEELRIRDKSTRKMERNQTIILAKERGRIEP